MKKTSLCMLVALTLVVTAAANAQMRQGTQGSSPGMNQPGAQQQQPGYPSQQPGGTMGGPEQNPNTQNAPEKTEKKVKGCVQSEGGQYVLQTKKGNVNLTGQDVSAHVGHEVAVKGMWESGGSKSSTASSGSSGKTFNVSSVDMISDTCKEKEKEKKGSSGSMGASSSSGTGTSGAGSSTGSQPPQ